MTDLDSTIARIKKEIESARLAKARSQAAMERAEQDRQQALDRLKQEFGLDNLADARVKLAQLRGSLTDSINQIEEKLRNF